MVDNETIRHGVEIRQRVYEYIVNYIQNHGYSPSVREIGDGVGLKSTSSVQSHLGRMFDEGVIETDAKFGSPRAIRVPGYRFVKVDEI